MPDNPYDPENWLPEYADLLPGEFDMVNGLKWPKTPESIAEDEKNANEAQFESDLATAQGNELETKKIKFLTGPYAYITTAEGKAVIDEALDPDDVDAFTVDFLTATANEQRVALNAMFAYIRKLVADQNWIENKTVKGLIQQIELTRLEYQEYKNNLIAEVPPTAFDDIVKGYTIGSLWKDIITLIEYECIDSKENEAVWVEI